MLSYLNENANNILLLFNKKYSSVLGGLYGRNGVLWISDDEVSDALDLTLNADGLEPSLPLRHLKDLARSVYPARSEPKLVCREHHVAESKTSVVNVGVCLFS